MHSDGFRGGGYNRLNVTPKLFWRITPRDRLRFNVSYNDDQFNLDTGIPLLPGPNNTFSVPPVNINNRYNTPGNFENVKQPIAQAFYEHDLSDNLRLRSSAEYQYISDQYWDAEANAIDTSTIPYQVLRGNSINPNTSSLFFFHHDHVALSQTDLVGSFHLLSKQQSMIGYEYDYHDHKTERSADAENLPIPPINLYNPVETAAAVTSFPASSYDGTHNLQNAMYFQDVAHVHPKLQVLLGGRYDAYKHFDFNYPVVNGVWQYGGPQNIFSQHPFTYRVGLISPLRPFLSLYANWAASFTAQVELSTAGNPLLPETGRQFEGGARMSFFQSRLSLNLAYFHINENNVAETRTDGVIYQANEQSSDGGELELRARASQKLNLFASYGFTQAAFGNFVLPGYFNPSVDVNLSGFVPALVPKVTERAWVNYDLSRGFNVSVGERYVSRRATDIFDLFWMPGFTTFDAAIQYRRGKMEYSVNMINALDSKYYVSAIDDTQVYPGSPINVSATIRYRF
jgi:iron complex outermembrane recepter protein